MKFITLQRDGHAAVVLKNIPGGTNLHVVADGTLVEEINKGNVLVRTLDEVSLEGWARSWYLESETEVGRLCMTKGPGDTVIAKNHDFPNVVLKASPGGAQKGEVANGTKMQILEMKDAEDVQVRVHEDVSKVGWVKRRNLIEEAAMVPSVPHPAIHAPVAGESRRNSDHLRLGVSAIFEDIEHSFGKAVGGLVLSEAAKAAAYASVMQVASKFENILTSIEDLVKKDKDLVHKVSKFANAFRPVQLAAHSLIVNMESTSLSLSGDLLPSLKDIWQDGDYQGVTPVIKEIQEAFEEPLEEFAEVKATYEDLAIKAQELSSEALGHSLGVSSSKFKYRVGGGASMTAVVGGAGAIVSSVVMAPLALAYLSAAGFVIAGGAGGIVINYSSHQFADEIMRNALLLSDVMLEIDKLMTIQSKNLITIQRKNKDILEHTKKIDKNAQVCASGTPNVKRTVEKVDRLLAMLTETSLALGKQCREYQEADTAGQKAVWEKLEKHANRANTLAD